ncbi:helix-turn-helix domain-containing protein [Streptomyces sp. NPDC058464]|uniref:helix-turn-helix domain-containing protein n=1 Tax=Streptomyces sp. NPDC058464 TaxID=3346511 RepID=UPI003664038C
MNTVSLLVEDHDFARWFVRTTLGDLARPQARDHHLRETLLRYLVSGRSLRAVADELHVAPNTVTYRVKQAEQLLPDRSTDDPLDLMVALCIALDLPEVLSEDAVSP